MKNRNGFVSNSSSSSFVVVTKKEHHEEIIKNSHPFAVACLKVLGIRETKFNGEDVVMIGEIETSGGHYIWEWGDEPDEDNFEFKENEEPSEIKCDSLYNYKDKAIELFGKDNVISFSIGS